MKAPVTLVIHTYADVPDDWDADAIQFYVEENHCLGNYLTQIQRDEPEGTCQLCSSARAYVGHRPFEVTP